MDGVKEPESSRALLSSTSHWERDEHDLAGRESLLREIEPLSLMSLNIGRNGEVSGSLDIISTETCRMTWFEAVPSSDLETLP